MSRAQAALAALGAALLALTPLALAVRGTWDADHAFVAVALVQAALYLVAARLLARVPGGPVTLAIVAGAAIAMRLMLVSETPIHSTDVYRYVWDGRVQAAGINPYRYPPADPALAALRDEAVFPNINRAEDAVTVYPPAAQAAFWLFTRLDDAVWAVKSGWLVLEAAAMLAIAGLLVRSGRPPAALLLYAWHPLPLWEIACDGHVDAGMMAFLVFALLAWAGGRRLLAGTLLALSVLFKPLTLAAAPALWRPWDWRLPAAALVVSAAAYLAYAAGGADVFGFMPRYAAEEGIAGGAGFLALRLAAMLVGPLPAAATAAYLAAAGLLLAGLAAACALARRTDAMTAACHAQVLLLALLLVLSPNYPWYFLVLVPLGCLAPWPPGRVATLLAPILYAAPPIDAAARTTLVQGILYASVMTAIAIDLYNRRTRRGEPRLDAKDGR